MSSQPLPALPDTKLKLAKKLLTLIKSWDEMEKLWVQLEMAGDNLDEQMKASLNCSEFKRLCTNSFSEKEANEIILSLQSKINCAKDKNKASENALIEELEGHQKKFYQLRQEVERTLPELTTVPDNICKMRSVYFSWGDIIRWTIETHVLLQSSIEAKKNRLPFDSPTISTI